MIIDVEVTEYRHGITTDQIGLSRDTHSQKRLRSTYAPGWFSSPSRWLWRADLAASPGFQHKVDKFAEVTAVEPWQDIIEYFARKAVAGGVQPPTGALHYPGRYPILNTGAMAAATEGLAGWFCEDRYHWHLIERPPRVTPDFVFAERGTGRYATVEVKSSGRLADPKSKLETDMIKVLRMLAPTKLLRPSVHYYAGLIMIQVAHATSVRLTSLVLEET